MEVIAGDRNFLAEVVSDVFFFRGSEWFIDHARRKKMAADSNLIFLKYTGIHVYTQNTCASYSS